MYIHMYIYIYILVVGLLLPRNGGHVGGGDLTNNVIINTSVNHMTNINTDIDSNTNTIMVINVSTNIISIISSDLGRLVLHELQVGASAQVRVPQGHII